MSLSSQPVFGSLPTGPTIPPTLLEKDHAPGAILAGIKEGRLAWASTTGVADAHSNAPLSTSAVFPAASLAKPLAAYVALDLIAQGLLSLDSDINSVLRSWKVPMSKTTQGKPITIRQLLSHTSGLQPPGFPGYGPGEALPTLLQVLRGLAPAKNKALWVGSRPGSRFAYSSAGYAVLQLVLEEVTQRSFAQLAQRAILSPCGMSHSQWSAPQDSLWSKRPPLPAPHNPRGQRLAENWRSFPEKAAAGLWTTLTDYATFASAWLQAYKGSPGPLSSSLCQQMATIQRGGWGLGWSVWGQGVRRRVGHDGRLAGGRSRVRLCPQTGFGMVLFIPSECSQSTLDGLTSWVSQVDRWP